MNAPVEFYCHCGHPEFDHRYRDTTPEKLLEGLAKDNNITVIHDPNSTKILGFKTLQGTYFTYEKALGEIQYARDNKSNCRPDMFDSKCNCQVFRVDNLKYLEDLSRERPAS